MSTLGNFPLSFREITRLAKKHGVKLTPGQTVGDFKHNSCGCALTVLAVANNISTTFEVRECIVVESDPDFRLKAMALECGFEQWGDRYNISRKNGVLFNRYSKIGQRLRSYAGY